MPIILVPTSHVADESIRKIKEVIEKAKPDCIAVELDQNRYMALKSGESSKPNMGFATNLIFSLLKGLQQRVGDMTGMIPGSEMLAAVESAAERGVPIHFIDQDMQIILASIKNISLSEKVRLIRYALRASLYMRKGGGGGIDLAKVPSEDIIENAMQVFEATFPRLYKILVEDRNHYMAARLDELSKDYRTIMAVVGAGHCKGIKNLLSTK